MTADEVTLTVDLSDCAADFGRRCQKIAEERRDIQDVQDAMSCPNFKREMHAVLDQFAKDYRASRPLLERRPRFTFTLGTYKSKKDMIKTVEGKGHQFSDWATQVINNKDFVLLGSPEKYEFIETTVKELTGKDQVKTPELYAAQYRLGFCDAPHESACAIREVYDDQPTDEYRYLLSKPVAGADGYLIVLGVGRISSGSFVSGRYAGPGSVWSGDVQLLVCRKCK